MKIVLLNNSFPFHGETFLGNEMNHIPKDISICIFPMFISKKSTLDKMKKSRPYKVIQLEYKVSLLNLLRIVMKSVCVIVEKKEYEPLFQRKNLLSNFLKLMSFTMKSEIRIFELRKFISNNMNTDLSIYSYWLYETAYIGARLKETLNVSKLFSRCHGYDLYEDRHRDNYLPFRKYIIESCDIIFPISENGRNYLINKYTYIEPSKIITSFLATENLFDFNKTKKKCNVINILSCSNIVKVKRLDKLVRALSYVKDLRINWYHIGDGPLKSEILNSAKSLPSNIKVYLLGSMSNETVMEFYKENYIDVFVNTSDSEGIPVSIMEAMSFYVPVIATNVGGNSEIVVDNCNGVILEKNFSEVDFRNALNQIINSEKKSNYRANARKLWEKKFSKNNFEVFYEIIKRMER